MWFPEWWDQGPEVAMRMCEMPQSEVDPNDREAMAELCKRATTSKLELDRERLNLEAKLRAEGR